MPTETAAEKAAREAVQENARSAAWAAGNNVPIYDHDGTMVGYEPSRIKVLPADADI